MRPREFAVALIVLAIARESQVHNDCTELQRETLDYLKTALGRLRREP